MKPIRCALALALCTAAVLTVSPLPAQGVYRTDDGLVLSDWALKDGTFHDADQYGIIDRRNYNQDYTRPITRQEFADYLYRTVCYNIQCGTEEIDLGQPVPFTDTDRNSVYCLAQLGITPGIGGGRFDPDGFLTREQAATFLARAGETVDFTFLPRTASPFTDADRIADWARDAANEMQSAGLMIGTDTGAFLPKDLLTKEQAAAMLVRFRAKNGVNSGLTIPKRPEDVTLEFFANLNGKYRPTGADSYQVTYRQDRFAAITLEVEGEKVTKAVYVRTGNGREIDLLAPDYEASMAFPDFPVLWTYLGGQMYEKSDLKAKTETLLMDGEPVLTMGGDEAYSFRYQKLNNGYLAFALKKDGTTEVYSLPAGELLFTLDGLYCGMDQYYIYTEETRYTAPTVDAAYSVYAVYTHDGTLVEPIGLTDPALYDKGYSVD